MKRSPGRPPLDDDDDTTKASVRLPAKEYDRVCSQARHDRESVSDLIRRGVRQVLADASNNNVRRK